MRELTPLVQVAGPSVWSICSEGLWFHCLERGGCTYNTAGSAGSGNPIRKRAGGSTTCSVEVLFVSSRGYSDGDWWFCCVGMAPLAP